MAKERVYISRCAETAVIPKQALRVYLGQNKDTLSLGMKADTNKTFQSIASLTFNELSVSFNQMEVAL